MSLRTPIRFLLMAALLIAFGSIQNALAIQSADERQILVRVADQNRLPVSGATVQLDYRTVFDPASLNFETDEAGIAIVRLPTDGKMVSIGVYQAGYLPRIRRWHNPGDEVPDEYSFTLAPSTEIGGSVKNEQGDPVAGARVELTFTNLTTAIFVDPSSVQMLFAHDRLAPTTDAEGRWSYQSAPADGIIRAKISHPHYLSKAIDASSSPNHATQADFRDGSAIIVLSTGQRGEDSVHSPDGRPIANAKLAMQNDSQSNPTFVMAQSDERGTFRMPAVGDGAYRMICTAKDFPPKALKLRVEKTTKPFDLELARGRTVKIHVGDENDQPLKAYVSLASIDGEDFSTAYHYPNRPDLPRTTDAAGLFEWTSAPAEKLEFSVGSPDYKLATTQISSDEQPEEARVKLEREAVLAGQVIDKDTRKPIDRFVVIPFDVRSTMLRNQGVVGRAGKFELPLARLSGAVSSFHLMIESEGRRILLTEQSFSPAKAGDNLTFELEAAAPISGTIVDLDGKPITEALVSIRERTGNLFASRAMELGRVLSDENGNFRYLAPPDDFSLAVSCAAGFLNKDLRASDSDLGKLTLKNWCKVSGRVTDRTGRPQAGETVYCRSTARGQWTGIQICLTDRDGKFEVERAYPGACEVWTNPNPQTANRNATTVKVPEGETATVELKLD